MYSIQEMIDKTTEQPKAIEKAMDKEKCFHPEDANIFSGQKRSVERELHESLNRLSLSQLLEYLVKSGTTGQAGAAYLVPDKVSQILYRASKQYDIVPLISAQVITSWNGGVLDVNLAKDDSYKAKYFGSGGELPAETVETAQATITPVSFGINAKITKDLIDDQQYGLIEWHLQHAVEKLSELAGDMSTTVLLTGTDGDGTVNSGTTGDADETRLVNGTTADVGDAVRGIGDDKFIADTMLITPEAWGHSVSTQASEVGWMYQNGKLGDLNVVKSTSPTLHASTDADGAAFTNCITVIFSKPNALLTGRKRWLQIDNYTDPIRDLAGAVISARQDSVTMYNDAIYVLTET